MNDKLKKTYIIALIICAVLVIIAGGTFAYLVIGNLSNTTAINGVTYNFDVALNVETLKSGDLIPVKDNLILSSLNSSHICEDTREYGLCSLYKITLTNNGSEQAMIGNLETINSTYTSNNLKYQLYTLNNNTYTAISDAGIVNNNKNAVNEFKINNNNVEVNIGSNSSKDIYLVIWISDPNTNQLEDNDKVYNGIITFASNRGDKVTSGFIGTNQMTYTVTFDADGGSVPIASKTVTYGERYGELPVPTKSGYTFKGWNGKNIFNINKVTKFSRVTFNGDVIFFDGSSISGNVASAINIQKYNGGSYVTTFNSQALSIGVHTFTFTKTTDFNRLLIKLNTSKGDPYFYLNNDEIFSDGVTYTLSYNVDSYDKNSAQATVSNFQVEIGNSNTTYEPYFVTSNTVVTQNKNHTLTAIWEKN